MANGMTKDASLEERVRAIEDRLEIQNFIAGYPLSADSASRDLADGFSSPGAILDMADQEKPHAMMLDVLSSPGFEEALAQGICHFSSPPYIEIDGDRAVATCYLQILAAAGDAKPFDLAAHGSSKGFRVWRIAVNRWEFARMSAGWRFTRRTIRALDQPASRAVLREATKSAG